jgi:hypothetical protein
VAIPPRQLHAHSVIRRGVLTPAALRNGAWQSVFRGLYVDSRLVHDHRRRCVEAVATLPGGSAIAGRSAAYLYGAGTVGPDEPIEVVVPVPGIPALPGLTLRVAALRAADVRVRGGLRITSPARTCWDLARWLDAAAAGVLVEALVRSRVVAVADLVAYARARAGVPGWRRLWAVAVIAVTRSGHRGVNGV